MKRRLTELFPFLLPLRRVQSKMCFYTKMYFDGNKYANKISHDNFKYQIYETKNLLINASTGQNIEYQYNKVHNIVLAVSCLNGLIILPNQTFSFWKLVKDADKKIPYKDGLTVINGKLKTEYGGGLCLLSSTLFKAFLHSPLQIAERHSHICKTFPDNKDDTIAGVDAAVSEGFKDLKIFNNTVNTYQIKVFTEKEYLRCVLLCDSPQEFLYKLKNGVIEYKREGMHMFQYATVIRDAFKQNELISAELLYTNKVRIDYDPETISRNEPKNALSN